MAWILESRLLGRFEVFSGDTEVRIPRGKQREMLVKLLASEGAIVTADELAEFFWPHLSSRNALNSVYTTMARLRRTLPGADGAGTDEAPIVTLDEGYRLQTKFVWTDVGCFREKAALASVAQAGGRLEAARGYLDEALALRRPGPILGGLRTRALIEDVVNPLITMLADARESWCGLGLQLGDNWTVLPFLEELAGEHEMNESIHAKLIRALFRTRGRAAALSAYYAIRDRVAEELGVDPGPELQALYQEILGPPTMRTTRREMASAGRGTKIR